MKLILIFLTSLNLVHATMRSLTPQELAANCYPSSPMLMSDMCFNQVYSAGDFNSIVNLPFSFNDIASLLQNPMFSGDQNNYYSTLPLGMYSQTPLWERTNPQMNTQGSFYGGMVK